MSGVTFEGVVKRYGETQVIQGLDLEIEDGEFCVFVGPSGCGKSTLLRMVAGLEETTGGRIRIGARDVTRVDPARRGVAMVFQTYALYPHMTVEQNMGFGLKMTGHPPGEVRARVAEASRILKLEDLLGRKPKALSGGQRQRVAIGRAIVRGPEVFLFDEPLSNLDAELRVEMRVEIARLHQEIGATMIYVTHDQVEAMTLDDKIVVLREGRIEQVGAPMELYREPDNRFVAGFIGSPTMNFLECRLVYEDNVLWAEGPGFKLALSNEHRSKLKGSAGKEMILGIRPSSFNKDGEGSEISLRVIVSEYLGSNSVLATRCAETDVLVEFATSSPVRGGTEMAFRVAPTDIMVFDKETDERL